MTEPSSGKNLLYAGWLRAQSFLAPIVLPMNTAGRRGYHRGVPQPVSLSVYGVYRAHHATRLREVLDGLGPGAAISLHALDRPHPALAAWTRAEGPGDRIPLITHLLEAHPVRAGDHLLVTDDDVSFVGAAGARFVGLAAAAGLDIAMPAHHPRSRHSFRMTRVVPLSTVRETTFVESGPVVLLSPKALDLVLPFPSAARMGWGLDVYWSRMRADGLRLGVVDATPVIHHGEVGAAYDNDAEEEFLNEQLNISGAGSAHDLARNVGRTWRPWQRAPRWMRTEA